MSKCRVSLQYERRHLEVTLELERLTQFHNYKNTVITYVHFLDELITDVVLTLAFLYRVLEATLQTAHSHSCVSEDLNTFHSRLDPKDEERQIPPKSLRKTLANGRRNKTLDRQTITRTHNTANPVRSSEVYN